MGLEEFMAFIYICNRVYRTIFVQQRLIGFCTPYRTWVEVPLVCDNKLQPYLGTVLASPEESPCSTDRKNIVPR